jgi:sec-independent protein translocase protein TatC
MPLDQTPYIGYDDEEENHFSDGKEMSFVEHLEELRWHIIRSVSVVVFFMLISFVYLQDIYHYIILAPGRTDFWTYRMMCKLADIVNQPGLCVDKLEFILQSREVGAQFMMAITYSAILGLILGFPYVFWEVWRFIKPGLKVNEQKAANGAVFFVSLLFFLGVFFGYYIVSPLAINFLVNFRIDPSIQNNFDIASYISLLATLTLACGLAFQLPVAIFVLTKIGIIGPDFLRTYRKYAVVLILIAAAIITPSPDITSQLLVAFPLYILYEISIFISAREVNRKLKEDQLLN